MTISQKKHEELKELMLSLGINESDIEEKFTLASGRGGQKINKTALKVHLKHIPTGIQVASSKTRLQSDNRFFARRELCERVQKQNGQLSLKEKKADKIRKQKKRRKRRFKDKD